MNLHSIETGNFKLDGGAMFGVVPKALWQNIYPADENNLCNWAMRCLLIDDGERKVLIDTGIGDKQSAKFFSYYFLNGDDSLLKSLDSKGYKPEDITDIIHTHLHFDHCGGTIMYDENKNLVPVFPNANIWVGKDHWELAVNPNKREKASFLEENILPMKESGKLILIEKEGEILPNISIMFFSGHTKGQVIPVINAYRNKIAFCGDLFPAAAHIPMPYIMGYDMWAEQTLRDKERFFEMAIAENYTLFFEHDLYNECCNIQLTEKGIRVKDKFTLDEWKKQNGIF